MGQGFGRNVRPEDGFGRTVKRATLAASLAALSLTATAPPAPADVTVGNVSPGPPIRCTGGNTGGHRSHIQTQVSPGNSYVVPSTGGIVLWKVVSWSTRVGSPLGPSSGGTGMTIYRPTGALFGPNYTAVGHDSRSLTTGIAPDSFNTFPVSGVLAKPGDLLGHAGTFCMFNGPRGSTGTILGTFLLLQDGASAEFVDSGLPPSRRLNASAQLTPVNVFTFGGIDLNTRKGTAKLTIDLPNPGAIDVFGKGVVRRSKTVEGPGEIQLKIAARGKKERKLERKGKVTLQPKLVFTPTGGESNLLAQRLKLKDKD